MLEKNMFRERVSVENKHSGVSLEDKHCRQRSNSFARDQRSHYRTRLSLQNKSLTLVEILQSVPTFQLTFLDAANLLDQGLDLTPIIVISQPSWSCEGSGKLYIFNILGIRTGCLFGTIYNHSNCCLYNYQPWNDILYIMSFKYTTSTPFL